MDSFIKIYIFFVFDCTFFLYVYLVQYTLIGTFEVLDVSGVLPVVLQSPHGFQFPNVGYQYVQIEHAWVCVE